MNFDQDPTIPYTLDHPSLDLGPVTHAELEDTAELGSVIAAAEFEASPQPVAFEGSDETRRAGGLSPVHQSSLEAQVEDVLYQTRVLEPTKASELLDCILAALPPIEQDYVVGRLSEVSATPGSLHGGALASILTHTASHQVLPRVFGRLYGAGVITAEDLGRLFRPSNLQPVGTLAPADPAQAV